MRPPGGNTLTHSLEALRIEPRGCVMHMGATLAASPRLRFEREERGKHQGATYPQNKNGQGDLPPR